MKTGDTILVPCNVGESPLAVVNKMPVLTGKALIDDWLKVEVVRESGMIEGILYCYAMPLNDVWKAFFWSNQHRRAYLEAIENRKTGSHWGRSVPWKELADLPWQKLDEDEYLDGVHLKNCQYYFLDESDTQRHLPFARQNFRLLSSFNESDLDSVELREGSHGAELVSKLVSEQIPNTAWLILGQARYEDKQEADALMVWSAFPGELTASIKHVAGFDGTVGSLLRSNLPIAVKGK
jgi:hypothetical protein